jgi:P27 family predicted phage terminase small subunit
MYCEAFATWTGATKKMQKNGPVVRKRIGRTSSMVQSPYFMVQKHAFDQMRHMATEFGMTPSSRTRITQTGDDGDDNPFL